MECSVSVAQTGRSWHWRDRGHGSDSQRTDILIKYVIHFQVTSDESLCRVKQTVRFWVLQVQVASQDIFMKHEFERFSLLSENVKYVHYRLAPGNIYGPRFFITSGEMTRWH